MSTTEFEKSKSQTLVQLIEYVPNSIVTRTIIRKKTGNISIVAIDRGEILAEKISPFDIFIQIIEGEAEITINEESMVLQSGQVILIPAHSSNSIKANERFKMITTVIKSGYEEVTVY